jgi:rubrerythrin
MSIRDLAGLQKTLKAMEDAELAAARMYAQCAVLWPSERSYWAGLVRDEQHHAAQLAKILALVAQHPDDFTPGRPFNEAGIQSFAQYVDSISGRLKSKRLDKAAFLALANDIENSMLESKYMEVVGTKNAQATQYLQTIQKDTARHKRSLGARLNENR